MGWVGDLFGDDVQDALDLKGGLDNLGDKLSGKDVADAAEDAAQIQADAGAQAIQQLLEAQKEQQALAQPFLEFGQGFIPQAEEAFQTTQQLIEAGRGQRPELTPLTGDFLPSQAPTGGFVPGQTTVEGFVPGQTNVPQALSGVRGVPQALSGVRGINGLVPGQTNVASALRGVGQAQGFIPGRVAAPDLGQNITIGDVLSSDEFGRLSEITQANLLRNQAVGGRVASSGTAQRLQDALLTRGSEILARERANQFQRGQFGLQRAGQQFGQGLARGQIGLAQQGQRFGQALGAQGQQFGQDLARGQLGLGAQAQQFGQALGAQAQQFGQALGAQQAQFGQDVTRGQLGLTQQQQQFAQDLARGQLGLAQEGQQFGQALGLGQLQLGQQQQQFGQSLAANQFQEALRQSDIANQFALQNALMGGVQFGGNTALGVGTQGIQTAGQIGNIQTGIANAQAAGLIGAANAQQGAFGNVLGFLGTVGGGLLGGPFGAAVGSSLFGTPTAPSSNPANFMGP